MVVISRRLSTLRQWFFRSVCLMLMTVLFFGTSVPAASAVGSQAAADVVNERAAAELDRVAGAGTSDQIEGAVDSTVGKAKRDIGRERTLWMRTVRLTSSTGQPIRSKVR